VDKEGWIIGVEYMFLFADMRAKYIRSFIIMDTKDGTALSHHGFTSCTYPSGVGRALPKGFNPRTSTFHSTKSIP
jgi:hypothetical protein